jgi:TolA-binding protein
MGLNEEAQKYADELATRFPENSWTAKAKKRLKTALKNVN